MPPLVLAGIGAASGIAKNVIQAGQEGKDRQLAADTQRYSPWTGMQAQMPKRGNVMGDVLGGATSAASFGQQFQNPGGDTSQAAAPAPQGMPTLGANTQLPKFDIAQYSPYK